MGKGKEEKVSGILTHLVFFFFLVVFLFSFYNLKKESLTSTNSTLTMD
jgi:hypothetical protein